MNPCPSRYTVNHRRGETLVCDRDPGHSGFHTAEALGLSWRWAHYEADPQ